MRILVIGHTGQLATALRETSLPAGWHLRTLGRPALDLCDAEAIAAVLTNDAPDVIINTAAYTAVDAAEENAEAAFALNHDAPARLARACARHAIPLIHISSDYVFAGNKGAPYTENDPPEPVSIYGRSKRAGEMAIRESGATHLIIRTAWLFSPYGHNFLRTILRLAEKGAPLHIVADQRGTPTCALHLAAALIALLARWHAEPETFPWNRTWHLAGAGHATWFELATAIMRAAPDFGLPSVPIQAIATTEYPAKAPRPPDSRLDCSAIDRALGIRLPPWREGVIASLQHLVSREGAS